MLNKINQTLLSAALCSPFLSLAAQAAQAADTGFAAQDLQTANWIREQAQNDNKSYAVLESLTSEVGARMAGSPADARAVAWAVAKFKELGFDKVWQEPVSFPNWQHGVERATVLAPYPHSLSITALGNSVATPAEGLQAEIVRFTSLDALKAAHADSVRGKIVFIDQKMHAAKDYGTLATTRSRGASAAAALGAIAFVMRSAGTDSHRIAHTGVMHYADGVAQIPAAAMSNPDADLLAHLLERQQAVKLQLQLTPAATGMATSYNVIAELRGSELPDEYVLIGGHLDSWDLGTGAIDDGAGCAISMAAAEFIQRHQLKPRRSIRVVLYANEERGLFGGRAYYQAHKQELHKIQAISEADSGQGPVLSFGASVAPQAQQLVQQMHSVLAPLSIVADNQRTDPGPDMEVLQEAGVPAFGLGLRTDDYFDIHHTADDTFDKIKPERINQAAAAYAVFAWMAAQAPGRFGNISPK